MNQISSWCHHNKIQRLCNDSRHCHPGDCFVAYKTSAVDRRDFIDQVIASGASAIIYEANQADSRLADLAVPSLAISNLFQCLSEVAEAVYGNASRDMLTIGVTGTNGKSSIVYYLAQAFTLLKQSAAMIGTFGNGFIDHLALTENTTPGVIEAYRLLAEFKQQGADVVAMEVSSHALVENRLDGMSIDTAVFTQLSRDHLDFHGSMQAYAQAKQQLFEWPDLSCAVFNIDDSYGRQWASLYVETMNVIATSCDKSNDWPGDIIQLIDASMGERDTALIIATPWGELSTSTILLGDFNIANLLSVIAVLGSQGISLVQMQSIIPQLQPAPGRMQVYGGGKVARVVVDYAHTPDALQKALQALRPYCQGRLWCVFGCGGDRDQGKRPEMAAVAGQYADQIVVTNDNPRTESPQVITDEIMAGFKKADNVQLVHEREKAIALACQQAHINDIILVAGKGHESYQIIGNDRIAFDDREVVQRCLQGE